MPTTEYSPADTDNAILRKIVTVLGGTPMPGDTDHVLFRKILECLNAVGSDASTPPMPGDWVANLLRKILTRYANDAVFLGAADSTALRASPADTNPALMRKILTWLGAAPMPGDSFNALLRKYLTQLNLVGPPI